MLKTVDIIGALFNDETDYSIDKKQGVAKQAVISILMLNQIMLISNRC